MEYFIRNQQFNKGLDPNIHVIDGIYNFKGSSTLHILIANYTNKHVTFNKGQCKGHIEPSINHMPQTSINSLNIQKMIDEHVAWDTFIPPLHNLPGNVRKSLNQLFETFNHNLCRMRHELAQHISQKCKLTQVTQNLSCRGHTPHLEALWLGKKWSNQHLDAQIIHSSHSHWSAPIIDVPKGDGRNCLVIAYRVLNKVTWKFEWSMPRDEDIFSKLNDAKYFSTLDLHAGYHHTPLNEDFILKTAFTSPFGKYECLKTPFGLAHVSVYFQDQWIKYQKTYSLIMPT